MRPSKRTSLFWLVVGLVLAVCVNVAQAQVLKVTLQNAQTGNATGVVEAISGMSMVRLDIVGAGLTGTVNFEAKARDATNFTAILCANTTTYVVATTATATGEWVCHIPGAGQFQARTSGMAAGSVTVFAEFGASGMNGNVVAAITTPASTASTTTAPVSPVEGSSLFNTNETSAAATAVTRSIAAVASTRVHLYGVSAYCSAGSATITVKDGVAGTTIWDAPAGFVGTVKTSLTWPTGLTSTTGNGMDVVCGSCGGAGTCTLQVQADRF